MEKYNPSDTAGNILKAWVQDPIIISEDVKESSIDACYQASFLSLIVAAHRILELAGDFTDEGNENDVYAMKKSLEKMISIYSLMV